MVLAIFWSCVRSRYIFNALDPLTNAAIANNDHAHCHPNNGDGACIRPATATNIAMNVILGLVSAKTSLTTYEFLTIALYLSQFVNKESRAKTRSAISVQDHFNARLGSKAESRHLFDGDSHTKNCQNFCLTFSKNGNNKTQATAFGSDRMYTGAPRIMKISIH